MEKFKQVIVHEEARMHSQFAKCFPITLSIFSPYFGACREEWADTVRDGAM